MLPVCLWLKHHKRSGKVKTGTSAQAFVWVREWLASSEYAGIVGFDTTPYSIGHIFVRLLKVRDNCVVDGWPEWVYVHLIFYLERQL